MTSRFGIIPSLPAVFFEPVPLLLASTVLRLLFLLYGFFQDSYSPVKYTDIDYLVFTDAARYVDAGLSPYRRETYRYTPLLAWILVPTSWGGWWSVWGKAVFAASDLVAGALIAKALQEQGLSQQRAWKYASIWLLNPMVATISTRGSSEGLLGAMVAGLIYCYAKRWITLTGAVLGLAAHFKIYPFIYGVPILWTLPATIMPHGGRSMLYSAINFPSRSRVIFLFTSLLTLGILNGLCYYTYGPSFLRHTYLHHLSRVDHRHNFSPYNTLLHLSSSLGSATSANDTPQAASLAFAPQLLLSTVILPLTLAKEAGRVPAIMFAQTLAFTTLNKVVTSQYFLWYLVVLPFYLPHSSLLRTPSKGVVVLGAWVGAQAWYLFQAYAVEWQGKSRFVSLGGLWGASLGFLAVNMWALGVVVEDISKMRNSVQVKSAMSDKDFRKPTLVSKSKLDQYE